LLFTEFDDSYLWDATARLLDLRVFAGMEDLTERRKATADKAGDLFRAGQARWNPTLVEEAAERAASLEPSDGWVDLKAAEILANLGDHQSARSYIAGARARFPRLAQVHMALAHEALRDGQPKAALGHLGDMAGFLPEGARPAAIYAQAHLAAGDTEGALPYLAKMASVDPGKPDVWIQWSDALAEMGRTRDALDTARRGMTATEDHPAMVSQLSSSCSSNRGSPVRSAPRHWNWPASPSKPIRSRINMPKRWPSR
jgi:predicted Zn-dependent protease